METTVTCEKCGIEFAAEDLSDLFEDGQNHYTCDDCYQKTRVAARKAAADYKRDYPDTTGET